ncbi:MAG: hypothetical protein KIC50_17135, partial [Enterocloster bolteae]|nr:hypothetical protein [Enterocloster bolteae]
KWGLEENYFRLLFSQNILPKMLRIFAKNVERAHRTRSLLDNPNMSIIINEVEYFYFCQI